MTVKSEGLKISEEVANALDPQKGQTRRFLGFEQGMEIKREFR